MDCPYENGSPINHSHKNFMKHRLRNWWEREFSKKKFQNFTSQIVLNGKIYNSEGITQKETTWIVTTIT